jgi:2',3'-cyclic-nucleotide 2'-phosphodiesterase (5'-nucleotidase family)
MGGLARRVSYIKAFKYRSNGEVPSLFVDAGNIFTDDKFNNGSLPVETLAKNRWVLKAYGEMRHDAANISSVDLPYLAELLKPEGYDERLKEYPFIKKLISANIKPADESHLAPAPYTIREFTLKRGTAGKKLKIGIVGFTEAKTGMMNQTQTIHAGFQIEDPFQVAKKILPELKQKTDFVIALAYMSETDVQKLASENPEIDTIIFGKHASGMGEPSHFNRATIASAYDQTKYMGELRVYLKSDGSVENQINRYVGLDSAIPDDPDALLLTTSAHDDFTNEQNKAAKSNVQPTSILTPTNSPFAGGEKCALCHQEEQAIWQKSGHAHAMATLENKNQQFDNECVKCHVVGFGQGGFQSLTNTPQFANVQCESCHGPGKSHAENPQKGYGFIQTPTGCVQCHTPANSPDFDFKSYWPKVKHGKRELAKTF